MGEKNLRYNSPVPLQPPALQAAAQSAQQRGWNGDARIQESDFDMSEEK